MICAVILAVWAGPAWPENPTDKKAEEVKVIRSSDISERRGDLDRIIEHITSARLRPAAKNTKEPPLIVFLVENSSFLKQQRFCPLFIEAINKAFPKYSAYRLAIVKFTDTPEVSFKPTNTLVDANNILENMFQNTDDHARDYCSAVKFCLDAFKDYPHKRHFVLFTLQNSLVTGKLEETLNLLKANRVTLDVISSGSVLYGSNVPYVLDGGITIPDTDSRTNELSGLSSHIAILGGNSNYYSNGYLHWYVSSGYGFFELSRLAAYSGGRYYVYFPPSRPQGQGQSFCEQHNCIWCSNKRIQHSCSAPYTKLSQDMSPMLLSAEEYNKKNKGQPVEGVITQTTYYNITNALDKIFASDISASDVISQTRSAVIEQYKKIKDIEDKLAKLGNKCEPRDRMNLMTTLAAVYAGYFNLNQYQHYLEQLKRPPSVENTVIWSEVECLCHLPQWIDMSDEAKDKNGYVKNSTADSVNKAMQVITINKLFDLYGQGKGEAALKYALTGIIRMLKETKNTPWELVIRRLPITRTYHFVMLGPPVPPTKAQRKEPPPEDPSHTKKVMTPTPKPQPTSSTPPPTGPKKVETK
ncbi:MAG: VWA domain-containing protein [Planctomycetota bacterium]